MRNTIQLDVVSDTICPWCYVGKRKLDQALNLLGNQDIQVTWRPYQLDPTIPKEGVDRKAYMKAKFGDSDRSRQMVGALIETGDQLGIKFDFDAITRSPNTLDSHRLIRWAGGAGRQQEVVTALFQAFFEQGADIGDAAALADIAGNAGMDKDVVSELLAGDADLQEIQKEIEIARQMGVTGVPTFIADGKRAVVGAQDAETLVRLLLTEDDPVPHHAPA